ncbi:hypothetical protein B296_00000962 [Ensete ventricosum]|uniref:Uncharacterized protein n=1 Tax=Ensete ventricosum TaxID=4639 RepID=A0A427AF87_ENSVE|nr:hypothetical protein B296_00000962 [Ensete ventricosum]
MALPYHMYDVSRESYLTYTATAPVSCKASHLRTLTLPPAVASLLSPPPPWFPFPAITWTTTPKGGWLGRGCSFSYETGGAKAVDLEDIEDVEDRTVAEGAGATVRQQLSCAQAAEGMPARDERRSLPPTHAHAAATPPFASSAAFPSPVLLSFLQQPHQRHRHRRLHPLPLHSTHLRRRSRPVIPLRCQRLSQIHRLGRSCSPHPHHHLLRLLFWVNFVCDEGGIGGTEAPRAGAAAHERQPLLEAPPLPPPDPLRLHYFLPPSPLLYCYYSCSITSSTSSLPSLSLLLSGVYSSM